MGEFTDPEQFEAFLGAWRGLSRPELDGEPVLRMALLHRDRVPLTHVRVEGVPDDVLAAYYEDEMHEEVRLEDLVAQYGGTIHETRSNAVAIAMTRARNGGYRLSELDEGGEKTHDAQFETLEHALWTAAFQYGHPPGTITWKEFSVR